MSRMTDDEVLRVSRDLADEFAARGWTGAAANIRHARKFALDQLNRRQDPCP